MQHIKLMFCSVKKISVILKLRRTHTPQYQFAVSKRNTNIKLRCLHHKMIISNTRRNIFIGIPLNLSIPTEMGYIQPLVDNKNSAKLQNCVILTYVRFFFAYMTHILNILIVKVRRIIKKNIIFYGKFQRCL